MTTEFDVIVIGAGGSGLAAAVSAADAGASVLVLEKGPGVGGSTARSVGALTAANTSLQRRAGIRDSVDEFIEDIKTSNGPLDEKEDVALRRLFARETGATYEWLVSLGVRFLGPFPEPPHRHPRLHNVLPNSRAYAAALLSAARKRGVHVRLSAPVVALIVEAGRVVGVRVGTEAMHARRGVVIASGDFSASGRMKAQGAGKSAGRVPAVNPYNTGDGLAIAGEVGAAVLPMDTVFETFRYVSKGRRDWLKAMTPAPLFARFAAPFARRLPRPVFSFIARGAMISWLAPSPEMYARGAIHISDAGARVADETANAELVRGAATAGGGSYVVFDETVAEQFARGGTPVASFPGVAEAFLPDVRVRRPDIFHSAGTIEALAGEIGVAAATLRATVAKWNAAVDSGADDEFGRGSLGAGLRRAPYYALGPLEPITVLTNGGLAIDTRFRVLDERRDAIPGLFAVGSAGQGGLQLLNNGLHISWAMTSGRLAGRLAAWNPPSIEPAAAAVVAAESGPRTEQALATERSTR